MREKFFARIRRTNLHPWAKSWIRAWQFSPLWVGFACCKEEVLLLAFRISHNHRHKACLYFIVILPRPHQKELHCMVENGWESKFFRSRKRCALSQCTKNILILEKLEKYFSPCLLSSVYTCDFVEQDFKQVFAKYFAALKGKVTNYEPC